MTVVCCAQLRSAGDMSKADGEPRPSMWRPASVTRSAYGRTAFAICNRIQGRSLVPIRVGLQNALAVRCAILLCYNECVTRHTLWLDADYEAGSPCANQSSK